MLSSSTNSSDCLVSEDGDDLFWWYLQFEQDKDPIARISEHISVSKRDASRIYMNLNTLSIQFKHFTLFFFIKKSISVTEKCVS